jgi:hypothetical protein
MPMDTQALVGVAEIALMAGVSRSAIPNWRVRYPDFPKPVAELQSGPVFLRLQVQEWLRRRNIPMASEKAVPSRPTDGTHIFRRTPDLAHYKEIVDIERIVQLSSELEQRLVNGLPHRENRSINFIPNHIYFKQSTGEDVFWWSGREWDDNGSFHHLFGHGTPGVSDTLFTEVEFNVLIVPPFRRKLGGAFLQDMRGKIWLAHRGIVTINVQGGRVSKKQFFEAMAQVDAEFTHDESFALIAKIESDNLIDEIEAFARKAREAKENLVKALGAS